MATINIGGIDFDIDAYTTSLAEAYKQVNKLEGKFKEFYKWIAFFNIERLENKLTYDEYYKRIVFFNIERLEKEIKIIHGY